MPKRRYTTYIRCVKIQTSEDLLIAGLDSVSKTTKKENLCMERTALTFRVSLSAWWKEGDTVT